MRRDIFQSFGGFDEQRYRRPAIEDIELGTCERCRPQDCARSSHFWQTSQALDPLSIIKTDVVDRGIPWTRLMWRAGRLAKSST
jgi:hypothetical protein